MPALGRYVALPHCDACGQPDCAPYGFGPPSWHSVQNFCPDCTPSRTGARGLPGTAQNLGAPPVQTDLFGSAA